MPDPLGDNAYMTIPVSEFEKLAQRAALVEHLEAKLLDQHLNQRERQKLLLETYGIAWPAGQDWYACVGDYIGMLQAAVKLRQTFGAPGG